MQPIIRWAGSKRQLLHKLRRLWPIGAKRYIEPFCGSACLFFDLEPSSAILGDRNSELISTYHALKLDASLVCECLRRLRKGETAYYKIRSVTPDTLSEAEIAARFLYLNRYCFNGIYRTNRGGEFNVPYGPQRRDTGFNFAMIGAAAQVLKRASLVNDDFEETLKLVEHGDFVYLDPPYAVARRRVFAEYHPETFTIRDLERLRRCLEELERKEVMFVVSYADCKEARDLFAAWSPQRVRIRRHIAGFAAHRRHAYELLVTNVEALSHAD